MNSAEIKALEAGDLQFHLEKLRKELFELKVKAATESIDNPCRIGDIKREIARLFTERRRREIAAGK
jgi:large subunit ribosomal protein L29